MSDETTADEAAAVTATTPEVSTEPTSEVETIDSELEQHAEQVAALIATGMNDVLAVGLASRWDSELSDQSIATMRGLIAKALLANLDAALRARGFVATE